jgi:hypothetical protein
MEPPVVLDRIAGNIVIDAATMRRRLGLTAFEVWVSFIWRRNKEGHSFASARSISRSRNLPYTSVRRACEKLTKMRLIQDPRWVLNSTGLKRFRRTIVGDYRKGIILINSDVKTMLNAKKSWGGARVNAGRPSKKNRETPDIQVDTTYEVNIPQDREITDIQDGATLIQVGRTLRRSLKKDIDYIPLKGNIMDRVAAPAFSSIFGTFDKNNSIDCEEEPPAPPESPVLDVHDKPGAYPLSEKDLPLETPSNDFSLNPPREQNKECKEMNTPKEDTRETPYIQVGQGSNPSIEKTMPMPPYPSVGFIGVPKVPAPPLLEADLTDESYVKTLAEAYRGAFRSRYDKPSYVMTRGSVKKSKFFRSFVACANFMRDNEIAPAAWAAFSLDCWISFGEKNEGSNKKPPPVNWVFSMKRLEERAGWFDREASSYGGGRLLFTRSHKELLRKYEGLKRAAHKELLTQDLIERFFPGGWEDHYDKAKKESAADQARLRDIVRQGEFVW